MIKLYEETVSREEPMAGSPGFVDVFCLRVMLFRFDVEWKRGIYVEYQPVYAVIEEYTSYVGEPGPERGPACHWKTRMYATGPDSARIRAAIAFADAFGGKASCDSE